MIKIGYNNSSKHYGSVSHYEKPARTHFCIDNLKKKYNENYFVNIPSDYKDMALELIQQVHTKDYINQIKNYRTNTIICRNCDRQNRLKIRISLDDFMISRPNCSSCDVKFDYDNMYCYASVDTFYTRYTFDIALEGIIVLKVLLDQMKNNLVKYSFAIIRPPGHHCNNDPNGFCIFNNVYVGAKQAQKIGWNKVLILDVDFHHGDGTQGLVEADEDPDISFVSIHGYGERIYPGTGKLSSPDDNILNIPLNMNTEMQSRKYITDTYYQEILVNQVFPFINEQNPDLIIISLGFDAHQDDPLEGMNLTDKTYLFLSEQLKTFNKPLLYVTEGGYNIKTINRLISQMIRIYE